MKREVNDFLEEITTNFSELFVETFLLRYLGEFDKNDLLGNIRKLRRILKQKVDIKLEKSLIDMGYDKKETEKIFK